MRIRPRRNRKTQAIRNMVSETDLNPSDFILPLFVTTGESVRDPINSMPDVYRYSIDHLVKEAKQAHRLGISAVALFPHIDEELKDSFATEAMNHHGLLPNAVRAIKDAVPDICVITDVAMDPYSSDGHDGIVESGRIVNDKTLDVLVRMAITQAQAGADVVAPSDMMDGRVGAIRQGLDAEGFTDVSIMAYSAKYASCFYGPFRDALNSAPKSGDKKTYQMDPCNRKEAIREVLLDIDEGADFVMVKPALSYLDVISTVAQHSSVPVAAYSVSGEYAMIKAAGEKGWIDSDRVMLEVLTSIKRAGADVILSYAAKDVAEKLQRTS